MENKETIEHCDVKDCPECNMKAFNAGKKEAEVALIAELEGMKKDTENIEVPKGSNIGEYRFVHSLKNEGHNQALDLIISNLRERIQ